MKPYQIFIFLLAVFLLIAGVIAVFPENGIRVSDDLHLKFAKFDDFSGENKIEYQDIEEIIDTTNSNRNIPVLLETLYKQIDDSTLYTPVFAGGTLKSIDIEHEHLNILRKIEFPDENKLVLYSFFEALRNNSDIIRIMHYGDSQIEGDRITSFIRYKLQTQFGGCGVGAVPVKQAHNYGNSIKHRVSSSWFRYNIKQHKSIVKGRRFGAMFSVARYTPYTAKTDTAEIALSAESDSLDTDSLSQIEKKHSGWITFKKNKRTYSTNTRYNQCKVYYGYNTKPVVAQLYANDELLYTEILKPSNRFNTLRWQVNSPEKLTIQFSGDDSPEIYGVALDGARGIAVDNISSRGSAGLDFTRVNQTHLKQMYEQMNVKLLILQFGGNVTPYITSNYDYYGRMFSAQLEGIRRILPFVSIIVIGPADMSRNIDGNYVSYPNIPDIRDALKEAAFNNGAAFWDMYEAMGGKNSMPSWVFSNPSLAAKDFTHFTHEGAHIIAKMFYNALINEYNEYLDYNQ